MRCIGINELVISHRVEKITYVFVRKEATDVESALRRKTVELSVRAGNV